MEVNRLSRKGIDSIALRFLQKFDRKLLEQAQPVPLDKIVTEHLKAKDGLQFRVEDLGYNSLQRKIWGRTYLVKKIIIIDQSLAQNPSLKNKYRFTLSHEIGHWVLHRKYINSKKSFYRIEDIEQRIITLKETIENFLDGILKEESFYDKWLEFQANSFAASLLMPSNLFTDHFYMEANAYGIKYKELLREKEYSHRYESILGYLSNLFSVSRQAAKIRVENLRLIEQDMEKGSTGFTQVKDVFKR